MSFKNILLLTAITGALGSTSALAGPSAKFAATWDESSPKYTALAVIENATADAIVLDRNDGYLLTTMKVPQDKELLVGVSAEIGIVTDTSIKGREGGAAKAIADGAAWVIVTATPVDGGATVTAAPGAVTLSARFQQMSATLAGVIEECTDYTGGIDGEGFSPGDEGYTDTPDGTIDVAIECIVSDEEIGLMQDTLASHHFNFVLPNMNAGEYEIKAHFFTSVEAAVDINEVSVAEGGTVSGSSYAEAFVGKNMVTVQQVRATQSLSDFDIVE